MKSKLLRVFIFCFLFILLAGCDSELQKETVTVDLDTQGGEELSELIVEKGHIFIIPEPKKLGYDFKGWYTNPDFEDLFEENTPINESKTLYAKWEMGLYSITFDTRGGTEIDPISQAYNTPVTQPLEPTYEGHVFLGWYSDRQFLYPYTFTTMPTENITIYAKWKYDQFTLTFNTVGGNLLPSHVLLYRDTLPLEDPVKTGYTFEGWFTDSNYDEPLTVTNMPASDTNLYAKWKINQYTITFTVNQGTAIDPITQDYNTNLVMPQDPERTGYTFAGWYLENNFATPYTPHNRIPAYDFNLYARWEINQYTITIDTNGGNEINPLTRNFNAIITIPNPTKTGYVFDGWYTDAELTQAFTLARMPAEDLALFAKWELAE